MNMNAFPLYLYKSNFKFQLRIERLIQYSRQRWQESAQPVESHKTTNGT